MEQNKKPQLLSIAFEALDIEGKTELVPVVSCPRRGHDRTPVALCGQCGNCREVAFVSRQDVLLACSWPSTNPEPAALPAKRLHELLQVPGLCVTPEMQVIDLLPHLARCNEDVVPVLDRDASLVGIVMVAKLLALLSADSNVHRSTVADVMSPGLCAVYVDDTLCDALGLLGRNDARPVAVINAHGRFLGLLTREAMLAIVDDIGAS